MRPFLKRQRTPKIASTPPKPPVHQIPPKAFALVAALYPVFVETLVRAELDGPSLFILSFVRRSQKLLDDGTPVRLHTEITRTVARLLGTDLKRASGEVQKLYDKGFIDYRIPRGESKQAPVEPNVPAGTQRRLVALTEQGRRTLETFNGYLNECFDELIGQVGKRKPIKVKTIRLIAARFGPIADELIQAAHTIAQRRIDDSPPQDSTD